MTLRNIPLGMKIGLGSVGPLVLVVLLGSVTTLSIRSLSETRAWVEHTHEVIEGTLEIEKLLVIPFSVDIVGSRSSTPKRQGFPANLRHNACH